MKTAAISALAVVLGCFLAGAAGAADWPAWRGPDGTGVSKETAWDATALDAGPKVLWKLNVGPGYSTVSVTGDQLFTMGNRNNEDTVFCLAAANGRVQWKYTYACPTGSSYPGPRATPVCDDGKLYTVSREGHVFCLSAADGTVKWQKQLTGELQAKNLTWGFASSVRISGKMALINANSAGVALNKDTGELVWTSVPGIGNYSVPVVHKIGGRPTVLLFAQKAFVGVDLSTGKELWSWPWEVSYDINAADPVPTGDRVFISSGYNKGSALLDVSGAKPQVVWQNTSLRNQFSSSVLLEGYLYGIDGNVGKGDLVCLDLATGKEQWRQNLGFGSLIAAGGKLIVLNEAGDLFVVQAKPDGFAQLSAAKSVLGRTCWTAPVLSNGRLYLRNDKGDLVCLNLVK